MLSYVISDESSKTTVDANNQNNLVDVHNRINNHDNDNHANNNNNIVNNESRRIIVTSPTRRSATNGFGPKIDNRNVIIRRRRNNCSNNSVNIAATETDDQVDNWEKEKRFSPRKSSLSSPQTTPKRNCLVRSNNSVHNLNCGTKSLKRVSFGSSKGSMVETLIYDHQDDYFTPHYYSKHPPPKRNGFYRTNLLVNGHTNQSPLQVVTTPEEEIISSESVAKPAKVKVTFFEGDKPNSLLLPEVACPNFEPEFNVVPNSVTMPSPVEKSMAERQMSTDSSNENPFRPDGELSKEADSIVELIKEGKPITPTKGGDHTVDNGISSPDGIQEDLIAPTQVNSVESAKPGVNGTTTKTVTVEPGSVDVQHSVVTPPGDAPEVEHVNIKKKPKCKCCVIQ